MNLNIRPILSALLRNRTGAVLVSLQIALALAVLVNATYIAKQRLESVNRPTGVDEANLFAIDAAGFTQRYDYASSVRDDLAYLRSLDGVVAATVTGSIPLSGSGNGAPFFRTPDHKPSNQVPAYLYEMDEQGLQTLGAHVIAGRSFTQAEIMPPMTPENSQRAIPGVVLTQSLADELIPGGHAVGKTIYDPFGRPTTVIGVASDMAGPWNFPGSPKGIAWVPQQPLIYGFHYLVRAKPGQRDTLMRIAPEHLAESNHDRAIRSVHSVESYKKSLFLTEKVTAIFLVMVTALVLAVATLGIFGLAIFNVSTRTKQIGTRRAVGARKLDIIQYFLVENGLITSVGIVVGCAMALGVGYWLSLHYHLPRLDLYYLTGGILGLWALGQLAAWHPARRAATVSPSVATRTA